MVLIIGHRGARCCAPENTIPSFKMAIEAGVDGIELDVHMTKDGEPVVIHDDTLDRTTTGSGYVKDHTTNELRNLDAGVKFDAKWRGVRIPTLDEVLKELGNKTSFVIELKHGSDVYPGIEEKVLNLVRKYNVRAKIVSFDFDALERVRQLDDSVELGLIFVGKARWFIDAARKLKAQWLQAEYTLINESDVNIAHESGLKIGAWTVNDVNIAVKLTRMGVDEVTTDNPSLIIGSLKYHK
ncbi:glycerophosphodiester phosphodiesterase [Caldivirga maquilingensis]|uniref:Glycerophosphodiester phosphodiesterase n=1 Tax=Caldivirga maquilingensis (strain ATCC 700844 / DSM 13496 / JCM 10307 / IC-167) TaxID=397948 RepID=A8MCE1_CALMQ|nr:glycerophosphodiester phosphodiesterase family protein [Caldivirga maquilingensis]ABW01447.1 Glycerophosphodiester phosphodiesterase [Caldivirga maquilingensis IC-167]